RDAAQAAVLGEAGLAARVRPLQCVHRDRIGRRAAADPHRARSRHPLRHQTPIAIVDAFLYGNSTYVVDVLKHAVLPALALGLLTAGVFLRLVRVNMLQTLRAGYVDAARARGLSDGVVPRRHAFRNALVPVVTVMGMQIALLLGGAVL